MRSVRLRRLAHAGTGVIMLLVLDTVCAPSFAWAGCNHLVASLSDPLLNLNRLDELIVASNSSSSARTPLDLPTPGRQSPCSGMSCSSRYPLPASTTSRGSNESDQWGGWTFLPSPMPSPLRSVQWTSRPPSSPARNRPSFILLGIDRALPVDPPSVFVREDAIPDRAVRS